MISTSFGWRVNYEDTYGEKFRIAAEKLFDIPIELRNYSVPGYNASQEYYAFVDIINNFKPNLLIVHHDHNDSQATGWGYPPNYIPPQYGDNFLNSAFLKIVIRQIKVVSNRWNLRTKTEDSRNEVVDGYYVSGPLYDSQPKLSSTIAKTGKGAGDPNCCDYF